MSTPPILRSLLAITAIAILCSIPVKSLAGEENPLVVVGISSDTVALVYPTPVYPVDCQRMHIQGNVEVRILVQNGKMVKVTATAKSPILAGVSSRWIRRNWQFKPTVSGLYVLPIVYQLNLS